MKRIVILTGVLLSLWSCATPKEITKDETKLNMHNEPVIEEKEKEQQDRIIIQRQTDDHVWLWVHQNKGPDEFLEDAEVCRPTKEVIDTFLNDAEQSFYLEGMIPHAAFNKCMFQKGWAIERKQKNSPTK